MIDLSIIVPIYNARHLLTDSVVQLIQACSRSPLNIEILICDDDSQDNSWQELNQLARQYPMIRLFKNDQNKGLGFTLRRLISETRSERIIYCDVDLPFGIDGIFAVADGLSQEDIVLGSRYAGKPNGVPFLRKLLSRTYCLICRFFFGVFIHDIGSGTVGFHKSKIQQLNLSSQGFDIHLELYVKAQQQQFLIKELGLPSNRTNGGSFSVVKHAPLIIVKTLQWWWQLMVKG